MPPKKPAKKSAPAPSNSEAARRQRALTDGSTAASLEAPAPAQDQHTAPFAIVGIGASAGGIAAYEEFFSGIPQGTDVGIAFVLVQHLSPDHKSLLVDLVRRYTKMQVDEVVDGMTVEANHAYIIPPNKEMALQDGRLSLFAMREPRGQRLPIDFFFRSLASEQRERSICVVLSGTGSDGALGVRAVKGEGGMAMAQDPSTAEHDGMPSSAIATGLVDYVLAPAQMPAQLVAYVRHAFKNAQPNEAVDKAADSTLKRLTSLLRAQTGHDFSQYKRSTFVRRTERRMALHQIVDHDAYVRFARENPGESEGLFRDLLIGVTSFFRDPEAFAALKSQVIARLLEEKSPQDQVRVWVCGCSTGEEAYSFAITLQEQLEAAKRSTKIQVFATDIDHVAIDHARAATFPSSIAADVSPERLSRFFVHDAARDVYRVHKVIRDMLVFSEQDAIKDPPFSRMDLISCRNLLIYLNADAQRKLISTFHYGLVPGGVLFLGNSETVGELTKFFVPLDRKWKIFRRRSDEPENARMEKGEYVPARREPASRQHPITRMAPFEQSSSWRGLTEQAMLAHYAEAGVLINGRGDILYIHGKTGKYLEPASGDAALNVMAMAREGLKRELTTGIHRAVAQKKAIEHRGLRVKTNGEYVVVDLTIRPVETAHSANSDLYLVVLEEVAETEKAEAYAPPSNDDANRVATLERELKAKEDYLQTTLEEMETTTEELKSTNEEMQSINEELQSTNEELETSKEELQSVNEELSTVNVELQDRIADLSRANNDMNNLLAGTGVGTVFVDNDMRILRFTPAATHVINLIPSDVGRPVGHIVSNLVGYDKLLNDIGDVLDSLLPKEAEVQTRIGTWYLMRIRPYRTSENAIEGVVLTFVDISERKRAEESLRKSEARFHSMFNQAFAGVTEMDRNGAFTFVNDRFTHLLDYSRADLLKMNGLELTHPNDRNRYREFFEALVAGGPDFSIEKRYRRRDGSFIWVADRASAIRNDGNDITSIVVVSIDLTARKRLEAEAANVDARLAQELAALSRLEQIHSLSLSPANSRAVFNEILDTALAINQADMGVLRLATPNEHRLSVAVQRGLSASFVDNLQSERDGAPSVQREPVVVEDIMESPLFAEQAVLDSYLNEGVRALQSLPMMTRHGAAVGTLTTYHRAPNRPDARKARLFDILARQAAEIIDRGSKLSDEPSHRASQPK